MRDRTPPGHDDRAAGASCASPRASRLKLVSLGLLVFAVLALTVAAFWAQRRDAARPDGARPEGAGPDAAQPAPEAATAAPALVPVAGPEGHATYAFAIMGTTIRVSVPAGDAAAGHAEAVLAVFRDVDARMSEWKDTSPLSAVNRAAGEAPVPVPDDLRSVVRRGIEIGELTGGAFDITWAALWGLWDFKAAEPVVPDPGEAARRAALVDYRRVVVDDEAGTVFLPVPGMKMGLGGIAKGHALDRSAAVLRERGVADFLILGGGQVLVGGTKRGESWRVGIRDPRGAPDDHFALVEVSDVSASTSGDYERYFLRDGVRYHHILNPATGMPARGVRGVTVISPDATLADALSTAIVVMGRERGMAVVEGIAGTEAMLVDAAGRVHVTGGLRGKLIERHPPLEEPR